MLYVFAIFHLNLFYSSVEINQRLPVIKQAYWPLLDLVAKHGIPIGIEAPAVTLDVIARLAPPWIGSMRRLCREGLCEFVGSGYAQIIGPLVPAEVNAANFRIGNRVYRRLLGFQPRTALVNEQAYSGGLVPHYLDAGYRGIVMEWDNAATAHPEWDPELGYLPQFAVGPRGERIPVLWNHSIAFQKLQRYAHGELTLQEMVEYVRRRIPKSGTRVFSVYANDAEVFDFRPGRYDTEAPFHPDGEWNRIARFFEALSTEPGVEWILPSQAFRWLSLPGAGTPLRLESPAQPIPVKKQPKYNPTRWAVTGRNDLWANTVCWRIYETLRGRDDAPEAAWRELCGLWASDYRTHITPRRWRAFKARLSRAAKKWVPSRKVQEGDSPRPPRAGVGPPFRIRRFDRFLELESDTIRVRLNCAKGLAVDALWFKAVDGNRPLCGTLPHGYYNHIEWGADFFTGHLVFQAPGRPKVTDLSPVEPEIRGEGSRLLIHARVPTSLGPVDKTIRVDPERPSVGLEYRLLWRRIPVGMLRMGHITLHPEAFELDSLCYRTANGGYVPETFRLGHEEMDHGASVSPLVTASQCVGITDGVFQFHDARKTLQVCIDKTYTALVGLVTCRRVRDTYFCRLALSGAETDETARPRMGAPKGIRASMTLTAHL